MEVRGLPEARPGGKPAVRMEREGASGGERGLGQTRIGGAPLSEDGDHRRERGVAGSVGGLAAYGEGPAVRLEREGSGGDGVPGTGMGKDER